MTKTLRFGESSVEARLRKRVSKSPGRPARECILLGDPTDCLLDAYDCVARRAYENFLAHGPRPGGELEDWLTAERQLLLNFPIDIQEAPHFIYALASVPGATAARVSVGIESRWMVILVRQSHESAGGAALRPSSERPASESMLEQWHSCRNSTEETSAKSVCVMGLPCAVDAARSIAVLADGVLGIRMAKLHPEI